MENLINGNIIKNQNKEIENDYISVVNKKIRSFKKKLRKIEDIEKKGVKDENQKQVLAKKDIYLNNLKQFEKIKEEMDKIYLKQQKKQENQEILLKQEKEEEINEKLNEIIRIMLLLWLKIINNDTDDSNILLLNEFKKKNFIRNEFRKCYTKN